jgi:hypothetical protein
MSLAISPNLIPLGHATYDDVAAAKALTATPTDGVPLPATANYAILNINAQAVRVTTNGTAPEAAKGLLLPAGTTMTFDNARDVLTGLQVIEVVAGAKVSIMYFRGPGG